MTSTEALDRRLANLQDHVNGEPYTGVIRMFVCGHPKTPDNMYWAPSRRSPCCRECARNRSRRHYADTHQPVICPTCDEPLGTGGHTFGYHSGVCEPTTCACETPEPDGLGECATCRRLVLSHSWHEGRP